MTDRIVLSNLVFSARHGLLPHERTTSQRFEVDVELHLDLRPAGLADDIARTIDYRAVATTVRSIVESTTFDLIEALAEAIAQELLAEQPLADAVVIRIRKPEVDLGTPLDHAAVEVTRARRGTARPA
jgi:dihydroneopterin aldolase